MATPNTYQNLSEQELVAAVKQGDCGAFKVIYELYRDRVFNLICYSLNDSILAEDVLQNVFIKIYRALPGFRFESSLGTWIYRITHNECQYQLKRRDQRNIPLEAILGSGKEISFHALPDEQHANNRWQEIVRGAIMDLSPKLRAVVELKYLEGLSYDEMAVVLGCSTGTVASRLSRALTELEMRLRPLKRIL